MKPSKLAIALVLAIATNAAIAATGASTTDSGRKWYEAGTNERQSHEQLQKLENEGFQQYID